jgi:Tfp pilus assembly protein PilP
MKARTLVSICLLAGAAWAQSAPPSQKVVPEAPGKKPAARAARAVARPAAKVAQRKTAAPARKAAAKPAAEPKAALRTLAAPGKRDPFLSPVREAGGPAEPTCTTGKKCLAIDTVDLKGIVRAPSGMIAVVESSTRRVTYFLRENDPVFNGYVVKITPDSIVFRENVMDRLGKTTTRDVVRKVVAPPV